MLQSKVTLYRDPLCLKPPISCLEFCEVSVWQKNFPPVQLPAENVLIFFISQTGVAFLLNFVIDADVYSKNPSKSILVG